MSLHSTTGSYNHGGHADVYEDTVILSKNRRIQLITDSTISPKCKEAHAAEKTLFRGTEKKEGLEAEADNQGKSCATSLYPPGAQKMMDLPPVTFTFWKCGLGSKDGCTCGVSRVETVPHDQMVAMDIGEYLSENACNAQCARGGEACWVCVEEFSGLPWDPTSSYHCQHKADAPFSYLGNPGMTQLECNGRWVCPKLVALPYEFKL